MCERSCASSHDLHERVEMFGIIRILLGPVVHVLHTPRLGGSLAYLKIVDVDLSTMSEDVDKPRNSFVSRDDPQVFGFGPSAFDGMRIFDLFAKRRGLRWGRGRCEFG